MVKPFFVKKAVLGGISFYKFFKVLNLSHFYLSCINKIKLSLTSISKQIVKNKKYILFNPLLVQRLSQKNAHVKKQSILSGQANV